MTSENTTRIERLREIRTVEQETIDNLFHFMVVCHGATASHGNGLTLHRVTNQFELDGSAQPLSIVISCFIRTTYVEPKLMFQLSSVNESAVVEKVVTRWDYLMQSTSSHQIHLEEWTPPMLGRGTYLLEAIDCMGLFGDPWQRLAAQVIHFGAGRDIRLVGL
jgi:hypothetical protein